MDNFQIGHKIDVSFDNFNPVFEKIKNLNNQINFDSYYENLCLVLIDIIDAQNEKIYVFRGSAYLDINFKQIIYKFKLFVNCVTLNFCFYDETDNGPFEFLTGPNGHKYSPDYFLYEYLGIDKKKYQDSILS